MRFRLFLFVSFAFTASWLGSLSEVAHACPMCQTANESKSGDALPRAYMYSILFMLAVPATMATGFGIGFYRLSKNREQFYVPGDGLVDVHSELQ